MDNLQKLIREVLQEQKRDRCLRIADRKFDKPSAYKSGAVVRCRKGDIWKDLKENQKLNQLPKGKIFDDAKNIEGIFQKSKYSWSEVIETYEKYKEHQQPTSINIQDIKITQPNIQANKVKNMLDKIDKLPPINVVEFKDGEKVIFDAHHRLVANWVLGKDKVEVNLVKINNLQEEQTQNITSSITSKKYLKYFNTIGEYPVIKDKISLLDNNREVGYIETIYIPSNSIVGDSLEDQKIKWMVDKPSVTGVYLEPTYREKGLGKRLYDEMKSLQNKKGFNLYKSYDLTSHGKRMWDKFKERGLVKTDKRGDYLQEDESLPNISFEIKNIIDNEYRILATISGKVIGSLSFIKSKYKPVLKATLISVDPSFRRKGIGSKMYEFVEEKLKTKFIKSDDVLTPDGKALWDNPNRKFGIENNLQEDESLHKWFKRQGTPGKEGGWVDCNSPIHKDGKITGYKACGRKEGEKRAKYPSCRPTAARCKDKGKGTKWGKTK